MSGTNDLEARIDGAFTAAKEKAKRNLKDQFQVNLERQKLLKEYEKAQARVVEIAKPRLEALARRAGDRASVTPSVSENRRSAKFEFKSTKATIRLTFSVAPDLLVKNAVVEYDLDVVPVLWRYESHAEFSTPVGAVDADTLARWLDDRIVGFVGLFIEIHEGELYEQAEQVEDPVAKVKFPKFAAGATLEHDGKTYYFIDDQTRAEFARQKGLATA
jgi:YHS domain-containing protein